MKIDVTLSDGNLTVKPEGRLDSSTADEFEAALMKALEDAGKEAAKLTVDLTAVDFISSKGLRALVAAYRKMEGREMEIAGANSSVMEVFRLSGLLKVFTVTEA